MYIRIAGFGWHTVWAYSYCGNGEARLGDIYLDHFTPVIRPIADRLLGPEGEIERGAMGWSNELAAHLIEVKNGAPVPALDGLDTAFQGEIAEIDHRLAADEARLMPGAMHPWMRPEAETQLWRHGHAEIYAAYTKGGAKISGEVFPPWADPTLISKLP
jgi:glutamate---cysteine ligase / carboxylate-amine ligase